MNNHGGQDYQTVDTGICKPKYASVCEDEYNLVKDGVKQNPDEAANFILNILTEQMENQIDFETNYLPIGFKIKGMKKEHPLQTLDKETAPVVLWNVDKPEDYRELVEDPDK